MSKINEVKQKQHNEKFARKMNLCYGCRQIQYYKECPLRKNVLIVTKRSQSKIKRAKMKNTVNSTKMETQK